MICYLEAVSISCKWDGRVVFCFLFWQGQFLTIFECVLKVIKYRNLKISKVNLASGLKRKVDTVVRTKKKRRKLMCNTCRISVSKHSDLWRSLKRIGKCLNGSVNKARYLLTLFHGLYTSQFERRKTLAKELESQAFQDRNYWQKVFVVSQWLFCI